MSPTVDELFIAAAPDAWAAAGFDVEGDLCEVGTVRLRFGGGGPRHHGLVGARRQRRSTSTGSTRAPRRLRRLPERTHPNGVVSIDHLVVITPALDRTSAVLQTAGLDLRRVREGETPGGSRRQAFFRMGELILEVVEAPPTQRRSPRTRAAPRASGASPSSSRISPPRRPRSASRSASRATPSSPGAGSRPSPTEAGLGTAVAFMTPGRGAI